MERNYLSSFRSNGNIIFLIFLICYFSYLILLSDKLVLSWDEPCSLHTSANLNEVVSLSYNFEGQPPAYFIILSLWRKFDNGIFFARFLSIVFTLLSSFFLFKLSRLFFDKVHTNWIVVLFLLNPFIVKYSTEVRLYSMLILLTLVASYTFYLIYFRSRTKYKIIFILIGLIGLYTQYFFVFIIISFSLILLFSKGWNSLKDYVLLIIPIAILSLPNLIFIEEGYRMHTNTKNELTVFNRLHFIIATIIHFFIPSIEFTVEKFLKWTFRIFFILLFSYSYLKLYIERNKNKSTKYFEKFSLLVFLLVILMFSFLTLFSLTNLVYSDHYLTIIFPFACISFAIFGIYNSFAKNTIYSIFTLYFILASVSNYRSPLIKNDNSKAVAEIIQRIEKPNEPILFYFNYRILPFQYYYNGKNILKPVPKLSFNHNFYNETFQDTIEFNQYLKKKTHNVNSFFLVTGNDPGFVIKRKLSNQLIDTYLKNNYIIKIDTSFPGKLNYHELRLRHLIIEPKKLGINNHIDEVYSTSR